MEVVSTCSCLGIVEQPPIPIISYNHPQPHPLTSLSSSSPSLLFSSSHHHHHYQVILNFITPSSFNSLQPHHLTSLSSSSPSSLLLSPHHHHQYHIHFPITYNSQHQHQEIIWVKTYLKYGDICNDIGKGKYLWIKISLDGKKKYLQQYREMPV